MFKRCSNLSASTVLQGLRMFKRCQNLPPINCGAGVQDVLAVSETTSHELWGRVAGCLNDVATYLPALCCRGAGCLSGVGTYLLGTLLQR